MVLKILKIKLF